MAAFPIGINPGCGLFLFPNDPPSAMSVIAGNSDFTNVLIKPTWAQLEASKNNYTAGFNLVQTYIDYINANLPGVQLWLNWQQNTFSANEYIANYPRYLWDIANAEYDTAYNPNSVASPNRIGALALKNSGGHYVSIWVSEVRARIIALVQAYYNQFASNPTFAGIVTGETVGGVNSANTDYSNAGKLAGWKALADNKTNMPNKAFIIGLNFMYSGNAAATREMGEYAYAAGVGTNAVDIMVGYSYTAADDNGNAHIKVARENSQRFGLGTAPICGMLAGNANAADGHLPTAAEVLAAARDDYGCDIVWFKRHQITPSNGRNFSPDAINAVAARLATDPYPWPWNDGTGSGTGSPTQPVASDPVVTSGSAGTGRTFNKPANLQDGDDWVVFLSTSGSSANSGTNFSTPSGFTLFKSYRATGSASNNPEIALFKKRVTDAASEPSTVSFDPTFAWTAVSFRVTGADESTFWGDDDNANSGTSGVTTLTVPEITTTEDNSLILGFACSANTSTGYIVEDLTVLQYSQPGSRAAWCGQQTFPTAGAAGARDFNWTTSGRSVAVVVEVLGAPSTADTTDPTTPGQPTVSNETTSTVDATWTGSTDADSGLKHYLAYLDGVLMAQNPHLTNSATFTGLASGTTYNSPGLQISAVDNAGNESALSTARTFTTVAPVDNSAPTGGGATSATADQQARTITLQMSTPTDNVNSASEIKYNIYEATSSGAQDFGSAPQYVTLPGETSYVANIDDPGTYYYVARPVDTTGNEDTNTNEVSATISTQSGAYVIPANTYQLDNGSGSVWANATVDVSYTVNGPTGFKQFATAYDLGQYTTDSNGYLPEIEIPTSEPGELDIKYESGGVLLGRAIRVATPVLT